MSKQKLHFAHTSDWHLRDTQYGYRQRGIDFVESAILCLDAIAEGGIKVVFNTGDIFNVPRQSSRTVEDLMRIDAHAVELGLSVYCITGNHDLSKPTWLESLFPVRKPGDLGIVPVDDKTFEVDGHTFAGLKYRTPAELTHEEFPWPEADVLLLHVPVDDFLPMPADNTLLEEELPKDKYKAILLGDLHIADYRQEGDCVWGYPGSTDMCSNTESARKSYGSFVMTETGEIESYSHVSFDSKPKVIMDIDSEDLFKSFVNQLESLRDADAIFVNVRYDRDLPDIKRRILTACRHLDRTTGNVVRVLALPSSKTQKVIESKLANAAGADVATPATFAIERFAGNMGLQQVSVKLANLPADDVRTNASLIIEDYIKTRREELKAARASKVVTV